MEPVSGEFYAESSEDEETGSDEAGDLSPAEDDAVFTAEFQVFLSSLL